MLKFILPITFLLFSCGKNSTYYVVRVVDGDTIVVQDGKEQRKIRLSGINTPETKDPRKPEECFGKEASYALKTLILGKNVEIDFQGKDKYNRDLGYVSLNGKSINETMIEGGFAFHYDKYDHKYENKYENLEQNAISQGKGLWSYCVNSYNYNQNNQQQQTYRQPQNSNSQTLIGSKIIAGDGTYLGKISNQYDSESIFNEFGSYGSEYSSSSIFNEFGQYGGEFSQYSPFNQFASSPPLIYVNGQPLYYLTVNTLKQPSINPFNLIAQYK